MNITETSSEGLKRQLRVVITANDVGARFQERMNEIKGTIQLKGFRKGKVPEAHLKKLFGRSMMVETLQQLVDESSRKVLTDRNERPASQPKIELPKDDGEIERVLSGQTDLAYDMSFEVLPDIQMADFSALKLTRLTAPVQDADVDEALARLAERNKQYEAEEGRVASDGDRVTIDFVGKINGEPFENGAGEDVPLVLGENQFIPGFEEGLKGAKAGDEPVIALTFPDTYPVETLKGQPATFEVKVKAVAKPIKPELDDAFAATLGVENLAKLREMLSEQIKRGHDEVARGKLKRALLDELEKSHTFELPPSLVEDEFERIWQQLTHEMEHAKRSFEDEGKTEDQARAEMRGLAERRVRLGLLLGEIGDKNKIEVTQEELRQVLISRAREFPGQEQKVYEYFEKNPHAVAELRAPIFEDKVVDFLIELAKPTEQVVSKEELLKTDADDDLPDGGAQDTSKPA